MLSDAAGEGELNQIFAARTEGGSNPLHLAAKLGNPAVVEWILKTWEEKHQTKIVNEKDEDGHTPLFLVCQEGFSGQEKILRKDP